MSKIHEKGKQIFKTPSTGSVTEESLKEESPAAKDYPRMRKINEDSNFSADRTLTANMTGQVTLTGSRFDLFFNKGTLKSIIKNGTAIFDKLNSSTFLSTGEDKFYYVNESAFAFESEDEYGLRSLQIPKKKEAPAGKVITDFIFNRKNEDAYLIFTVHYPEMNEELTINESALFEIRISGRVSEQSIISEGKTSKSDKEAVLPAKGESTFIEGNSFRISNGKRCMRISFIDEYDSQKYSKPSGLAVKTVSKYGKRRLMLNPGGSYTPAPASYYSGIIEQFCIKLEILETDNI